MIVDKRATLQVRIFMNKLFGNKNSVNKSLAALITSFSHSTVVQYGTVFQRTKGTPEYYVIQKCHSPFWVTTVWMPSKVQIAVHPFFPLRNICFVPDWHRSGHFQKKKIFDPYGLPYIKKRNARFYFQVPFFLRGY